MNVGVNAGDVVSRDEIVDLLQLLERQLIEERDMFNDACCDVLVPAIAMIERLAYARKVLP